MEADRKSVEEQRIMDPVGKILLRMEFQILRGKGFMAVISDIKNREDLYSFQKQMQVPYFFPTSYENWEKSMFGDRDGRGETLFRELHTKAAYEEGILTGYIQYGKTAFGFDERGELSDSVFCQVIRSLYFKEGEERSGQKLLEEAMKELQEKERIYAFYHYFGMSCYARHGKLFEKMKQIETLLQENGFTVEHENVYYSSRLESETMPENRIRLKWGKMTAGNQRSCSFLMEDLCVGNCEVHFLEQPDIAYLRWIFISDAMQNQGIGTECISCLKQDLYCRGIRKFDTDTALKNHRAQHFYEKNGFKKEGITRSYFLSERKYRKTMPEDMKQFSK